ncbi:TPA: restriction endonuclease subunit S [Neisseria meningitidis]
MKRQITIGEIAEINANSLTQKDMFQEIMYLDTGNITRNEIDNIQVLNVMMDKIPSRAKRKVKDKTIIYSTVRPNQEHYGFLENPGDNFIISTGFSTIDVYDENTDEKFIYYLLTQKHITDYLHTIGENSVSSYPSINPDDIANLKFAVPDLKTQQSIAAVLSALDKKIALNKQINARLEDMEKTLYDYWFVQFDFPDANGKPYKSSGGEIVFDETLKREIPKGWGSIELQSCLAKIPNTTKILNKDIKDFGKYPVVDQSQDFICGFTNDEKSILNPQDAHIIFGDHTRIVKLVNFQYARGADGTQVILSNNERMPNYLFYQIINQIDLSSYGYARHFKFLKEFKIILPSKDISQKYNEIANTFFVKVRNNIKQNHQLTQLRDFLLPMLMNGQVSVAE